MSIWDYAKKYSRDYITPEDIGEAISAGESKASVQQEVLDALGRKVCEDWSCCAFVAGRYDSEATEAAARRRRNEKARAKRARARSGS